MFGNVQACGHRLGGDRARWTAALCGVCLAVRDAAGQLARPLLVTDAAALAALVAEASPGPVGVVDAGRCPLRGMRTARVMAPDDRATQVGVAGALLAAWTRTRDAALDGDAPGGAVGRSVAARFARRLEAPARAAGRRAGSDLAAVDAALRASADAERRRSTVLDDWTDPAAAATAAVVAGLADPALDRVAQRIGRATLLADAVGDLADDGRRGRPNPILAGAVDRAAAVAAVRAEAAAVAAEVAERCGPTSLSATLWGPCWSAGLRAQLRGGHRAATHGGHADGRGHADGHSRAHGRGHARGLSVVATAGLLGAVALASTGPGPGFTWAGVDDPLDQRRRAQDDGGGCCDTDCGGCSCDCCCCCGDGAVCCGDGASCCDGGCCDCGDCCSCDC